MRKEGKEGWGRRGCHTESFDVTLSETKSLFFSQGKLREGSVLVYKGRFFGRFAPSE